MNVLTFFSSTNLKMNDDEPEYWIYHERQEAMLCGQHALNNLVQRNVFQPGRLAEIAHQLDHMELNFMAQNNEGGVRYVFTCLKYSLTSETCLVFPKLKSYAPY